MDNEIRLYGPIGGYSGITPKEILDQIPKGAEEITLRIHSPGGSVGDGLAMYNAIKDHPARVIAIIDGYAASSASFLMLAADEVRVHESSLIFLHKPWSAAQGNADDMRKSADDLDKHEEAILGIYTRKTGRSDEEMRKILRDETFLTGSEAIEMGFADVLIDDPEAELEVAALLEFDAKIQEKIMSTQKTRRDIQAELDEAVASIESVKAEAQAKVDEVQAALIEKDTAIAAHLQTIADLTEAKEAEGALLVAANAQIETLGETLAEREAAIEAHAEIVAALETKLANPAYSDASLQSVGEISVAAQAQLDAEADASEASARAPEEEASCYEKWNALKAEGKAQAAHAYHREHAEQIKADQQKLIQDWKEEQK